MNLKHIVLKVEGKEYPEDGYRPLDWGPNFQVRPIWAETNRILKALTDNPGTPISYKDFVSGTHARII